MGELLLFYLIAALMVAAALSVVGSRLPIYSVLSLLVVMGCQAVFFVMLHAYFVAAIQLLLYAGAVLVLFLFVIMLLQLSPEAVAYPRLLSRPAIGITAAFGLFLILRTVFFRSLAQEPPLADLSRPHSTVEAIAHALMTKYLLPFELTSLLILAALIGAVTLAKQQASDSRLKR